MSSHAGYFGAILEIDLTRGTIDKKSVAPDDYEKFVGGRGLGMKLLWDRIPQPGVDPLSPENPLMFMPGPLSGFPVPSASRTCVVTKSPHTQPKSSKYPFASTVSYANMGGFFGPEIRFAGYDGIVVTGKSATPVYIAIDDDKAEIRDAQKFWGMKTDEFDKKFLQELGDRNYKTCYIGPAGENLVSYACIVNTAARAAGRGGTGCVMGSKKLKAVAVKGSRMPAAADHEKFVSLLDEARQTFKNWDRTKHWRNDGTAGAITLASEQGRQAVRNYREGMFPEADKLGAAASRETAWARDFACYCCPLACKKSGSVHKGPYVGLVHDGPEYETGTMLGPNLLISDLGGVLKAIYAGDDYGIDIISVGNVIGFLMEAYEKGSIDRPFLDGIDLKWGNVEAVIQMIEKISTRNGIGNLAAGGVKLLAEKIAGDCHKFAIHAKGQELAAWNVHVAPDTGVSYTTSNRGACHINGGNATRQNLTAILDSLGICLFAWGFGLDNHLPPILSAVTGSEWSGDKFMEAGERIFNLEKMFNYREGFRREDDVLPDRFFEEPLTVGPHKGAVLARGKFDEILTNYYKERGWDHNTTEPGKTKLESLGLGFTLTPG